MSERHHSIAYCLEICIFGLALCHGWANADDWPRFQGPNGNCTSDETGLMKKWPADGPKVLWTTKVGAGFGGVVVENGKVYILDRETSNKDILRCIDLGTGEDLWTFSYDAPGRISYPGSRSHPTLDKDNVYIAGPMGDLHCISKETHKPVWHINMLEKFEARLPRWAMSQAPALYKNTVIVAPVGRSAGVVALDRKSGQTVWKSQSLEGQTSYASPIVTTIGGVDQVMVITTTGITGVDASNGKILWYNGDWQCRIPIASPVHLGDGRVFTSGGYGSGSIMLRVSKTAGGFETKTIFKNADCKGQIHQPILYKGHLYVNANDKGKREGLMCMDLDGNTKWKTFRTPGFDWGGMLLADNMLYVVDGDRGELCLVKPDPAGYQELGRAKYLGGEQIWGTIAISEGKILLRDQKQLRCVDIKGP